jgi:hypothetical protein
MNAITRGAPSVLLGALLLLGAVLPASADEAAFRTAYAAADSAVKQAAALRNQWTTTVSTLAAAKKAAEGGDFDRALAQAREAEALAKASIYQAESEKDAWQALEIR